MTAFLVGAFLGVCVGIIIFYLLGMAKDDCEYMSRYEEQLLENQSLKRQIKLKQLEVEEIHELLIETQEVLRGKNEKTA
ncbi:MAG TPA: hypothetical protein PLD55_12420 [bacterium]|nr:hypothetical protein [bacterium]